MMLKKKQRRIIGSFFEIDLGDGYYSYGRILPKANYAFYDLHAQERVTDLKVIAARPILFIVAVYEDVITEGRWKVIGKHPLEERLESLPFKFIQDKHTGAIELYNSNTGDITPASRDEVEGLESAAVWEANHVEDRLRDHYAGRKNVWVEQLRVK